MTDLGPEWGPVVAYLWLDAAKLLFLVILRWFTKAL